MPAKHIPDDAPASLRDLLQTVDDDMRDLFIKVMNLHAAHQIAPRTQPQLAAEVRKKIEESLEQ